MGGGGGLPHNVSAEQFLGHSSACIHHKQKEERKKSRSLRASPRQKQRRRIPAPSCFYDRPRLRKNSPALEREREKKVKSLHAQLNGGVNSSREKLDSTDRSSAGFRGCQRERRRGPRKGELDYLKLQLCSRAALPPSVTSERPSVLAERKKEKKKDFHHENKMFFGGFF